MPNEMPTKEELEAEMDRARRDAPKYRFRASGYLIIPVLAAIYVVGGILYLYTLFDPAAPAAGNYEDVGTFFLAIGLLMVGAIAYTLFMMAVNATLSRPVDFLVILAFTSTMFLIFYLIGQWAKPHLGIT
jgi:hypothetical protein